MRLSWLWCFVISGCATHAPLAWPATGSTRESAAATDRTPGSASATDRAPTSASPTVAPALSTATTSTSLAAQPEAPSLGCSAQPKELGRIQDVELNEVSGVVESRKNPQILFVHNDSGDSPRFFALDRRGQVRAELVLDNVPILLDAEDIAIGPGPGGASFIYLGDTGNNFASSGLGIPRRKAVLYRIAEPDIPSTDSRAKLSIRDAFPIVLTFPKGARDVEAFLVDPLSGDLLMLSKQRDGHSQLLTASAAQLAGGGGELQLLGELRFGQPPLDGSTMPTSASVSRDGNAILVRTYSSVFLFHRQPGQSLAAALGSAPTVLPAPREPQGEAISFVDHDRAFVTISEGVKPAVYCVALP